jgi:hypothetical protein
LRCPYYRIQRGEERRWSEGMENDVQMHVGRVGKVQTTSQFGQHGPRKEREGEKGRQTGEIG